MKLFNVPLQNKYDSKDKIKFVILMFCSCCKFKANLDWIGQWNKISLTFFGNFWISQDDVAYINMDPVPLSMLEVIDGSDTTTSASLQQKSGNGTSCDEVFLFIFLFSKYWFLYSYLR